MANLPTVANRLNDIEISSNGPQTESLWRRVGSNVNFLLDFLGVVNGETDPTGTLSDLSQAVELASTHTMDLQLTIPNGAANGVFNIGTFTQKKFLNQIFYFVVTNTSGFGYSKTYDWQSVQTNIRMGLDAVTPEILQKSQNGNTMYQYQTDLDLLSGNESSSRSYSRAINHGDQFLNLSQAGFNPPLREYLLPVAVIDWRDGGTTFDVEVLINVGSGNYDNVKFYRQYVLEVGSLGY